MTKKNWRNKFFYGWVIVAVATLALLVSNGLAVLGIPVFYKHIQEDLIRLGAVAPDRIQTVYGFAPAMTFLLAGFFAPVAGFLIQKLRARGMMIIGCFILGGGLLLYSQAQTAATVYLAHILLGASLGFVGVLVNTVLISEWFSRRRGLALGIVLTGTSFGGVFVPLVSTPLILQYGWRTAMMLVSLLVWIVLLPAVIFLVRNSPADLNQFPDGASVEEIESADSKTGKKIAETGLTLAEALRTPIFWVFSLCAALIFYAIFVVSQQLNLYLQGEKIGFSAQQASFAQSMLFALSVAGKFLFGWLSDKFAATRVMLVSASTMFLSTLTFLHFTDQTVYLFAVLFGLNYGGTFVLLQLLVADYFGLKNYGKILGAVTVIETAGGALGTIITGRIADLSGGDYAPGFYGLILVTGLAFGLVLLLNFMYGKRENNQSARNDFKR